MWTLISKEVDVSTPIAPHLTAFMREHLPQERRLSANTCEAYAYAFQLLLEFASSVHKKPPSALTLEQLDGNPSASGV
jgi:site-specific recombinase XerC